MIDKYIACDVARRDEMIAEANQRIIGNMLDVIKRLAQNPDGEIEPIISLIQSQSVSRSENIKAKKLLVRDECEKFARREVI
jgi:hypothetical protein